MTENKLFENIYFGDIMQEEEYYNCRFVSCDFSGVFINRSDFEGCSFELCNFTMTKFTQLLTDVSFYECKMIGSDFTELSRCSRGMMFNDSVMDYCIFTAQKLRNMKFCNCRIHEAYFNESDIAGSLFDQCDLLNTDFSGSNLEKVDFYSSYNFSIVPESCKLKKTVFSEHELRGLVSHLNIVIK